MSTAPMTLHDQPPESLSGGPFKFLDFYTGADSTKFAGREREILDIHGLALSSRALVLYGRSGLGKTSLLLAGVLPKFEPASYLVVYVRTLESPLADLRDAIVRASGLAHDDDQSLTELVRRAENGRTMLLVFDQFEEFFIRFRDKPRERESFVRTIGALLNERDLDVRTLFSVREDNLAKLDEFRRHVPDMFDAQYRLLPLTAFGARRAIVRSLEHADIAFEPLLLRRLVDMLAEFNFDPAILQIVCTEVYRGAAARTGGIPANLTVADIQDTNVDEIFRRYIKAATDAIEPADQLLARSVLDALITQERTKRAVPLDFFETADFTADPDRVATVANILHAQRILRRELRGNTFWYELLHERLIAHIEPWLNIDRMFHKFRATRDLIANGERGDAWLADPELLLNAGQMTGLVDEFRKHLRLDERQLEFVLRSAIHRRSPHLQFWAGAYGLERCRDILLKQLDSDRPELRCSAAQAVPSLAGKVDDGLRQSCLRRALDDESDDVRRAAGKTLAVVATDTEIGQLAAALQAPATASRAQEVLADFHSKGRRIEGMSWLRRLRARREAERREVRTNLHEIEDRARIGAVAGVLASLAWASTVGLAFNTFLAVTSGLFSNLGDLLGNIGKVAAIGIVPVVALGFFLGRSVARSAACLSTIDRSEPHWIRAAWRMPMFWTLCAVALGTFATLAVLEKLSRSLGYLGVAAAIMAGLAYCIVAVALVIALVGGAMHCLTSRTTRLRQWVWLLGLSAGWPLCVTLLARHLSGGNRRFDELSIMFSFFVSAAFLIATVAISHSVPASPKGRFRRLPALALGTGVVVTLAYGLSAYGLHTFPLPLFTTEISLREATQVVEMPVGFGPGDVSYRRLHLDGSHSLIVRPQLLRGSGTVELAGVELTSDDLFFPPGSHLLAVGKGKPGANLIRLSVLPIWDASPSQSMPGNYEYAIVQLHYDRNRQALVGELQGEWPDGDRSNTKLRLSPQLLLHEARLSIAIDFVASLKADGSDEPVEVSFATPTSGLDVAEAGREKGIEIAAGDATRWRVEFSLVSPGRSMPAIVEFFTQKQYGAALPTLLVRTQLVSDPARFDLAAGQPLPKIERDSIVTVPLQEQVPWNDTLVATATGRWPDGWRYMSVKFGGLAPRRSQSNLFDFSNSEVGGRRAYVVIDSATGATCRHLPFAYPLDNQRQVFLERGDVDNWTLVSF